MNEKEYKVKLFGKDKRKDKNNKIFELWLNMKNKKEKI